MKIFNKILLAVGILLLCINIFGLFKTMRNPEVYSEEKNIRNRINDISIKYPEILEMLKRKPNENNVDFGVRINKVVNDGFIHYWKTAGIDKYHERVPVWENYLLYAASYINPEKYRMYEFSNYRKNLERGVGLCSTHSTIVKGVLLENGIKAELLDVGGHHVVVRAELNDTATYMLDPDYGIFVPHDTAAITANPELVREPYKNMAELYYPDAVDPYTTDILVKIFGDRKHVYSVENWFETFSYWAIWIIPFLLMLPFVICWFRK
ncbi:MAG TPA: hypothetical protein PLC80_02330 [Draconibacterium sp.]|nr:hypothetical protein [Draconibacterium sp.]